MKIGVPSGIGDISWIVSKLINSDQWKDMEMVIADGWPFRAAPYLDMVGIKNSYGEFKYEDIVSFEHLHKDISRMWGRIVDKNAGMFLLQPNHHLERGLALQDWLPDLPTNYHYPLNIPTISPRLSNSVSRLNKGDWVGISCASYRGASAWKTWEVKEWKELALLLKAEGWKVCLLGGGWDDLTDALEYELSGNSCINLTGKTDFGEACAIHRILKGYIGFSSGLGIIRSVMGLPTMMLWPDHQQALSMSWADPVDVIEKRYIARPYLEPELISKVFISQMREFGG